MTPRTPALVNKTCDGLPRRVSTQFRARAARMARRAEMRHPINKAPSTVAASAVYLTTLLEPDHGYTQDEVADAADVSAVAIRNCYAEIAEAEGITLSRSQGRPAEVEQ